MIRIVKLSGKYYGYKFDNIEDEAENIKSFVSQCEPVILVAELDDLKELDIEPDDVEIVD